MGNRGRIITENRDLCVYLHWNGGYDSVSAFLKYCELKGYPSPERDFYGWARLCQVIGNYFGGSSSVGIYLYEGPSTEDNGVYVIRDWKIVDRITSAWFASEQETHPMDQMLLDIDERQPERFGGRFLKAVETPRDEIEIGDTIILYDELTEEVLEFEVVRRSTHETYDWSDPNHPTRYNPLMILRYPGNEHYEADHHRGNLLTEATYRVVR